MCMESLRQPFFMMLQRPISYDQPKPELHLREIAEISGISHSTLVKRAAKHKSRLDYLSPRRLAATDVNFEILGLPEEIWLRLVRKASVSDGKQEADQKEVRSRIKSRK